MTKMLVIAPYKGLAELIYEVNKSLKKEIDVEVGNLYKGVEIASSLESKSYDVIISRGATAKLIREQTNIPVVEIKISGYDILRAMMLLKGYQGKIGSMSFFNIVQGIDEVGKLLGMDIHTYLVQSEKDLEEMIVKARDEKTQMIIGDVITTAVAQRYGLNGILITSGKEAVIDAIELAEEIIFYTKKEKSIKKVYRRFIDASEDGIIVVDQNGICQEINEKAAEYLGVNHESLLGKRMTNDIPFLNFKAVLQERKEEKYNNAFVGNDTLYVEKFPVIEDGMLLGAALFLKPMNSRNTENSGINHETGAYVQFPQLIAKSAEINKVIQTAKNISQSDLPILIVGEPGSGKKSMAQAIHNESKRKINGFKLVNCAKEQVNVLEEMLFGSAGMDGEQSVFEQANGGTVCLENILRLPYYLQLHLSDYLEKQDINVRMITLSEENILEKVQQGYFSEKLYKQLHAYVLHMPPLRNRDKDFDEFLRSFIASANIKIGKQIVGMTPQVLEQLHQFSWPQNIKQLKSVVEQMCFISEGPYIEFAEVAPILNSLTHEGKATNFSTDLSNKTLDETMREVILHVLEEEGQNQSKAAARLGINRSTLWRRLKTLKNV